MRNYLIALLIVGVCGVASDAPAAITISSNETYAAVDDFGGNSNVVNIPNTGGTVATATVPGFLSQTTSNYSTFGNGASFSGTFDQQRGGGNVFAYAFGYLHVFFSTNLTVPYSAAGLYSNSNGYTETGGYLLDLTTSSYLYYNDQQNSSNAFAAFTLGGLGGNVSNSFTGSLTGALLAGHSFEWFYSGYTQARPTADLGAVASGSGSLSIANVPEASSLIVWSIFALTMGGVCWWKRSKAVA